MALAVNAQTKVTDVTELLTNPDFEKGTEGWSISGGNGNWQVAKTAKDYGYHGTNFMEDWTDAANPLPDLDCHQTITKVNDGIYLLTALAHAERQNDVSLVIEGMKMYANWDSVSVSGRPAQPKEYKVATVVSDGTLTVGYNGKNINANWVAWDNVKIFLVDKEDPEALPIIKNSISNAIVHAQIALELEGQMSKSVRDALTDALKAAADTASISTYDDAFALFKSLRNNANLAEQLVVAYEKLVEKIEEIVQNVLIESEMNGYAELEAMVVAAMDKYEAASLDLSGIEAELKALDEAVFAFRVANADGTESFDVTDRFVTNPTVRTKEATAGWTIENVLRDGKPIDNMPAWGHNTMEFWNCDFTLSQTIKDIPNGKYVIKVQGYYREGVMNNGSNLGKENITAELFGNKSSVPLTSIYQYKASAMGVTVNVHKDHDYINGLEGANAAFNILNTATGRNYYDDNELMVIVMDNTLTFGVRNTSTVFDRWCAFRDFRLEYFGNFPGINLAGKIQEYKNYMEDNIDNIPYAVYLEMAGYIWEVEESGLTSPDAAEAEVNAAILALDSVWAEAQVSFGIYEDLKALASRVENESLPLNYPGTEELQKVLKEAQTYFVPETEINTREAMLAMIDKLESAIVDYVFSQNCTREKPADVSYYIVKPFSKTKTYGFSDWKVEVVGKSKGDVWEGPGRDWIIGTDTIKTTCLNSWSDNFVSMNAYLEITGLLDGVYSVTANAITQKDCLNDQHAYISSSMGIAVSDTLSNEGWDKQEWDTLTTDLLVVADGKLRIGFASTSTGTPGTNGWFQVANFVLKYHGEATADDMKAAWESTQVRANEAVDILLIGDEGSLITALGAATPLAADAKYAEACIMINPIVDGLYTAMSVTKDFYGKSNYAKLKEDTTYAKYEYTSQVVDAALAFADVLLTADTTTYRALDSLDKKLSGYVAYVNVLKSAEARIDTIEYDAKGLALVTDSVIKPQVAALVEKFQSKTTCDDMVKNLQNALNQLWLTGAGDVSSLIKNPGIDDASATGWTVVKGTGNGPTITGQHYSGDGNNRYMDSWAASGLNFTAYQTLDSIPNGVYRLTVAARTSAGGNNAYIFATEDTLGAAIDTVKWSKNAQWEMIRSYGDVGGEIWENGTEEQKKVNENKGRGWSWHVIDSIEVTAHTLTIGVTADSTLTMQPAFTGSWLGADDWKLELLKYVADENYDPFTGVEEVEVIAPVIIVRDGAIYSSTGAPVVVYSIDGKRAATAGLSRGIYIVICENTVTKVVVR